MIKIEKFDKVLELFGTSDSVDKIREVKKDWNEVDHFMFKHYRRTKEWYVEAKYMTFLAIFPIDAQKLKDSLKAYGIRKFVINDKSTLVLDMVVDFFMIDIKMCDVVMVQMVEDEKASACPVFEIEQNTKEVNYKIPV